MKTLKQELKELLKKHKATISFSVSDCSDTHGLSDEKIVVYSDSERIEVNGYCVDSSDL